MTTAAYFEAIRSSRLTIYDPLPVYSPLYIPTRELEGMLNSGLRGFSVAGLPIRTRSKVVKSRVCEVLGYPVPKTFRKEQPRFPGQNLDTYTQASNNLQIWNEELVPTRRYAIIREQDGILSNVRVVTGESLALLDKTGTLTQKYQARFDHGDVATELVCPVDTTPMLQLVGVAQLHGSPTDYPQANAILPIREVFERLRPLVGRTFPDAGRNQERNRGGALHVIACNALGFAKYADDGQFPDIKNQVLELKLQTRPTIDLGLVTPNSTEVVDVPPLAGIQPRHCDCRYAIFGAVTDGHTVSIRSVHVTTGEAFFSRFPRFGGKVINKKIQIPLPRSFFRESERPEDLFT